MLAIRTPFRFSAGGGVATTNDLYEIAEQEIRDVLVTAPGERSMRPSHTGLLQTLIFDSSDPLGMADVSVEATTRSQELASFYVVQSVRIRSTDQQTNGGLSAETIIEASALYSLPPDTGVRTAVFTISGLITEETR